jgi:predicted transcriptional regulator
MGAITHDFRGPPGPSESAEGAGFAFQSVVPSGVGFNDSAVRVISASTHQALWTISEQCRLDEVLDEMSQRGVRAFLVARERQVVGLIAWDDIKRECGTPWSAHRAADVMTDAAHLPMIEWHTILDATVSDLLQIFDSNHLHHLMVVEKQSSTVTRVRGLVYRRQLVQQLGAFPRFSTACASRDLRPVTGQ